MSYPAIVCHLPTLETLQDSPEGGANLESKGAILAPTMIQILKNKFLDTSELDAKILYAQVLYFECTMFFVITKQ